MGKRNVENSDHNVILVVGAASLDRLLTVPNYPAPDAKIRSTDYNEVGGGNAANSASAIARLADAKCWKQDKKMIVKLLTKLGSDEVGKSIIKQLQDSNVDMSSPLFMIGPEGSKTSVCTILVDSESHTRTCIFTHGDCGELTVEDIQSVNIDDIFENVIHLHSDSRHTEAALALAREAKSRGIQVSLDCEKVRKDPSFDKLMEISDMIVINSNCLEPYLNRLEASLLGASNRPPMKAMNTKRELSFDDETLQIYMKSFVPNAFFSRWYPNTQRQCIVTHGSRGALHFRNVWTSTVPRSGDIDSNTLCIKRVGGAIRIEHDYTDSTEDQGEPFTCRNHYDVHQTGVLKNAHVVDTTGAGDAFIGAFLLAKYAGGYMPKQAMEFAAWVSGKKLEGFGAQSALPRGVDVDQQLGVLPKDVATSLCNLVGRQFNGKDDDSS
ncbi:unnamed protein product [Cylindrotheca closterium]|uniref:Carbohydrate kinase PfkB domain-containing protein n=1 Tax=Cylindrotheca closterium TaxID=2856 RepID=A0AAD2FW41_9STRA|nr:unnamed protein product [Cylindrotheca closterium]